MKKKQKNLDMVFSSDRIPQLVNNLLFFVYEGVMNNLMLAFTFLLINFCYLGISEAQVHTIELDGDLTATVNFVDGLEYDMVGDALQAIQKFKVSCGPDEDWVDVTTSELDGTTDVDLIFIPSFASDHPILMSSSHVVGVPMATVYTCTFEVESNTTSAYNGVSVAFTLDPGAGGAPKL